MASPLTLFQYTPDNPFRVALIAMPWALFNRPSIQLGALKAYLQEKTDWIRVDAFHPYLEVAGRVGPEIYHSISQNLWLSEALYGALVFPERREEIAGFIGRAKRSAEKTVKARFATEKILDILNDELVLLPDRHKLHRYHLIGFSVCFHQLLASLAAAAQIKSSLPQAPPIVFGGSSCAGDMGPALAASFSQIDYTVNGEGELPLLGLCEFLAGKKEHLPKTQGLDEGKGNWSDADRQLAEIDNLPIPDFHDYFTELRNLFTGSPFIPQIPIEFSRGCWWSKCTFCNLNLQWHGYRKKNPHRMLHEVVSLADRHQSLDFAFTDNSLPKQESLDFFQSLAEQDRDYRFFGEIKAAMQHRGWQQHFAMYRRGGLTTIQVGIESLSSSLLTKMAKGVTVIENIAAMRDALEHGLVLEGNLITEFPGSTDAEVLETLDNLDYVFPYLPLSAASFFLGHGSPIARHPADFHIRSIKHHPASRKIFPDSILRTLHLLVMDYSGDRVRQKKIWQPVVRKIKAWQDFHRKRRRSAHNHPPLSYRDGGGYIIIRQEKADLTTLHHRLQKQSREIYLFCHDIRTLHELYARFPACRENQLNDFLRELVDKRLLFEDNGRYLALAVRSRTRGPHDISHIRPRKT